MEKTPKFHYNENLLREYKDKLSQLVSNMDADAMLDLMNKAKSKSDDLKAKYGNDVYKHALYHALIFSTIHPDSDITVDDFPGEDSVVLFIDKLANSETLG